MKEERPGRLSGKRVLLTGTAGGQGVAAQRLFAQQGARVEGCDIRPGGSEDTAAELAADGYDVRGSTVDLTDADAAAQWVHDAAARLGGIDVVYNNAAGYGFSPFAEMTLDLWKHVIHAELDIIFHVTHPAWQYLCLQGGSIINIASVSALRGMAHLGITAHAAANGGVIAFTTALSAEGALAGIRVNAISPGFVSSPATDDTVDSAGRDWMLSKHLIQRAGNGADIGYAAMYLASDESSWVTGQNFSVDGGWTAGYR